MPGTTPQGILSEKSPMHYQYKGKYLMTAVKSGLMIIDQYRAGVRILYDRYMQQMESHTASSQQVLFPEVVQFAPSDAVLLPKLLPLLAGIGFDLTDLVVIALPLTASLPASMVLTPSACSVSWSMMPMSSATNSRRSTRSWP